MGTRKAKREPIDDACTRCHNFKAKYLVDVHAAVRVLARLCGRCANQHLVKYPASSAVEIKQYEQ